MTKDTIKIKKALVSARNVIWIDRHSLIECHKKPESGKVEDVHGLKALADYDAAISHIDDALAALSAEQQEEAQPCELGDACLCVRESGCASESCRHYTDAATSDAQPQEQPNWQRVPSKPTPEMLDNIAAFVDVDRNDADVIYRAMLAAAPLTVQPASKAEVDIQEVAFELNPYKNSGLPKESWRRGFLGERLIAMPGSGSEKLYNEGRQARKEYDITHCATSKEASAPVICAPFPGMDEPWPAEKIAEFEAALNEYEEASEAAQDETFDDLCRQYDIAGTAMTGIAQTFYAAGIRAAQAAQPCRDDVVAANVRMRNQAWDAALDEAQHLCESNATMRAGEVAKLIRALRAQPASVPVQAKDTGLERALQKLMRLRSEHQSSDGRREADTGAWIGQSEEAEIYDAGLRDAIAAVRNLQSQPAPESASVPVQAVTLQQIEQAAKEMDVEKTIGGMYLIGPNSLLAFVRRLLAGSAKTDKTGEENG